LFNATIDKCSTYTVNTTPYRYTDRNTSESIQQPDFK